MPDIQVLIDAVAKGAAPAAVIMFLLILILVYIIIRKDKAAEKSNDRLITIVEGVTRQQTLLEASINSTATHTMENNRVTALLASAIERNTVRLEDALNFLGSLK